MITKSYYIVLSLLFFTYVLGATKHYWDLGVVIDKQESHTIQQEVDFSTIESADDINVYYEDIKAFRANNFIAPILHNLKYPTFNKSNGIKKYDEFIFSLSTSETVNFIKRSFLNDQFTQFFSLYGQIKINEVASTENINSMYIQNLYRSNQFDAVMEIFNTIPPETVTDELLLYKIKTNIQLGNFNIAQDQIELFQTRFQNSHLLRYINYEQQLLNNKNEK